MAYTYEELASWNVRNGGLVPVHAGVLSGQPVEYHRLQIERFIWDRVITMGAPVLDIGAEYQRPYLPFSLTVNSSMYSTPYTDVRPSAIASITSMPFKSGSIATVIATETLEHVPNVVAAVREVYRVLMPGGLFLATTPFLWPTHNTQDYGDYWRITEQGWRWLLQQFRSVTVLHTEMRPTSKSLWHGIMGMEVMGNGVETTSPTGYLIEARKG